MRLESKGVPRGGSRAAPRALLLAGTLLALGPAGALVPMATAHRVDEDVTTGGEGASGALQHPLGRATLSLRDGDRRRVRFRARWRGPTAPIDPRTTGALLRISGGPGEGDSGVVELPKTGWSGRERRFRYTDPDGRQGGIRSVVLRVGARGGVVSLVGGPPNWRYALEGPQSRIAVTVTIGPARWCAGFEPRHLVENAARRLRGRLGAAPASCPCGGIITSTWEAIQGVLASHGCTATVCHGNHPGEGRLDLRPEVAWASLVDVPSTVLPSQRRVLPGDKDASLLWRKLAARTIALAGVPGTAMPVGEAPALSEDELTLIALWIYNGASPTGVVPGTERLLASCLPSATPQKIPPPEPPAIDEGVQLHGPPWSVPVAGEDEVCYATHYDFSDRIPARFRSPCPEGRGQPGAECFHYKRAELIQDPNSHHSIPRVYLGASDVSHPTFGPFTCHGGPHDGMPCRPKGRGVPAPEGAECGTGGGCAGKVVSSVACIGYGPPDFSFGFDLAQSRNAPYVLISTEPRYETRFPTGVVEAMPVRGVMAWNSHAFNVTDQPTTNEQWLRLFFAAPEEQRFLLQDFFDVVDIFVADVPPFEQREYCRTFTFERGTRLFEVTSHTHKRGKLFRMWGPGISPPCRSSRGDDCRPEPGEPFLVTTDYADPHQVVFEEPLALDGEDAASRTFKYCALYDNGLSDPADVKRRSTAPPEAVGCTDAELRCLAGPAKGRPCGGNDRACDSAPGAGDGLCDACPVRGWVTADDEMFALIGSYYCADGIDCVLPSRLPEVLPPVLPPLPGF